MKKLDELNRLVDEAMTELLEAPLASTQKRILTTLARKCAEINVHDLVIVYKGNEYIYNSRLRDGQVEEVKQEEKPALQPLPEALPDFMLHDNRSNLSSLQLWEKIRQHFGTPPREWWRDLKKGDKFVDKNGEIRAFDGRIFLGTNNGGGIICDVSNCSPYTDPTQSFREKLTPEMQVEFDKLMEGQQNG